MLAHAPFFFVSKRTFVGVVGCRVSMEWKGVGVNDAWEALQDGFVVSNRRVLGDVGGCHRVIRSKWCLRTIYRYR